MASSAQERLYERPFELDSAGKRRPIFDFEVYLEAPTFLFSLFTGGPGFWVTPEVARVSYWVMGVPGSVVEKCCGMKDKLLFLLLPTGNSGD